MIQYVANKRLEIQKGTDAKGVPVMEVRLPGEAVPEASTWPNVETWVRSGWITPVGSVAATPVAKMTPAVAPDATAEEATPAVKKRSKAAKA